VHDVLHDGTLVEVHRLVGAHTADRLWCVCAVRGVGNASSIHESLWSARQQASPIGCQANDLKQDSECDTLDGRRSCAQDLQNAAGMQG